jgi:hypothetical protein
MNFRKHQRVCYQVCTQTGRGNRSRRDPEYLQPPPFAQSPKKTTLDRTCMSAFHTRKNRIGIEVCSSVHCKLDRRRTFLCTKKEEKVAVYGSL